MVVKSQDEIYNDIMYYIHVTYIYLCLRFVDLYGPVCLY